MSSILTEASVLQCSTHKLPMTATPGDTRVKVDGSPVLRPGDTFEFACQGSQTPCKTVVWTASGKTKIGGQPALRSDDKGTITPTGVVTVVSVQGKTSGG